MERLNDEDFDVVDEDELSTLVVDGGVESRIDVPETPRERRALSTNGRELKIFREIQNSILQQTIFPFFI